MLFLLEVEHLWKPLTEYAATGITFAFAALNGGLTDQDYKKKNPAKSKPNTHMQRALKGRSDKLAIKTST